MLKTIGLIGLAFCLFWGVTQTNAETTPGNITFKSTLKPDKPKLPQTNNSGGNTSSSSSTTSSGGNTASSGKNLPSTGETRRLVLTIVGVVILFIVFLVYISRKKNKEKCL